MTVIEKRIHWHLIRSKLKKCLCFVSIVNLLPIRAFGKFPMLRSFCNRIRQKIVLSKQTLLYRRQTACPCLPSPTCWRIRRGKTQLEFRSTRMARPPGCPLFCCLFVFVYFVCFWDLIPLKWLDHLRIHSFAHPLISKHL